MTVSFHKFGEYFPGTGDVKVISLVPLPCCSTAAVLTIRIVALLLPPTPQDTGHGEGKGYSLNFPLKDGMDDRSFVGIFRPVGATTSQSLSPQNRINQTIATPNKCEFESSTGNPACNGSLSPRSHLLTMRRRLPLWGPPGLLQFDTQGYTACSPHPLSVLWAIAE